MTSLLTYKTRKDLIMKKIISLISVLIVIITLFAACSEADKANHNMSKDADYFNIERKITVYNARTDYIIFEAEGYMSISNSLMNELVITCKTGNNTYKKNYVYLNDYIMYAIEDISGTHSDPYHYKWYFHTEILPDIEIKP